MKRRLMLALVVSGALVVPATASADVVTSWDRTMVAALDVAGTPPPPAMRAAAIVQAAVFDAVDGVARRYTAVHVQPAAPAGVSRAAAAAGAAHEALVALFPAQQATFDQKLADTLAQISDGDGGGRSVNLGLAWGTAVADRILAWRAGDGFSAVLPAYLPAVGVAGRWQPTPPLFAGPLFRQFATMTPWALASPSQFLPAAPPPLNSARYARDFDEVKTLGGSTSSLRTAFQTETAKFWAADTPAAIWNRVADDLAEARAGSLVANARVLALLNMALADAVIAVWNAKNSFDSWRPITAIEQAATDGNPDTSPDSSWAPLITTPAFQEYPAGHPGVSNAGASVLAHFYGNDTSFTATSFGLPGVEHSFSSFSSAVAEVENARIWGGIHFRFACDTAVGMGAAVADYVTGTQLLRIHGRSDGDDSDN
jgi:PAP2 superfamily